MPADDDDALRRLCDLLRCNLFGYARDGRLHELAAAKS